VDSLISKTPFHNNSRIFSIAKYNIFCFFLIIPSIGLCESEFNIRYYSQGEKLLIQKMVSHHTSDEHFVVKSWIFDQIEKKIHPLPFKNYEFVDISQEGKLLIKPNDTQRYQVHQTNGHLITNLYPPISQKYADLEANKILDYLEQCYEAAKSKEETRLCHTEITVYSVGHSAFWVDTKNIILFTYATGNYFSVLKCTSKNIETGKPNQLIEKSVCGDFLGSISSDKVEAYADVSVSNIGRGWFVMQHISGIYSMKARYRENKLWFDPREVVRLEVGSSKPSIQFPTYGNFFYIHRTEKTGVRIEKYFINGYQIDLDYKVIAHNLPFSAKVNPSEEDVSYVFENKLCFRKLKDDELEGKETCYPLN